MVTKVSSHSEIPKEDQKPRESKCSQIARILIAVSAALAGVIAMNNMDYHECLHFNDRVCEKLSSSLFNVEVDGAKYFDRAYPQCIFVYPEPKGVEMMYRFKLEKGDFQSRTKEDPNNPCFQKLLNRKTIDFHGVSHPKSDGEKVPSLLENMKGYVQSIFG